MTEQTMTPDEVPAATHYATLTPTGGNLCYPIRPGFPVPDGATLLVPISYVAELIAADVEYDEIRGQLFLLMLADPRRGLLEDQLASSRKRRAAAIAACRGL